MGALTCESPGPLRAPRAQALGELEVGLQDEPGGRDLALRALAQGLSAWSLVPSGTEGFRKAEVTRGGVDTRELSSTTMEARKAPGLYFIGEVVDVTGWLGGYNFQWAWASGVAAGRAAAQPSAPDRKSTRLNSSHT